MSFAFITKTIVLPARISDNFGDPIQKVLNLISQITALDPNRKIILNYEGVKFTNPFFLMSLTLIVDQFTKRGYDIQISNTFRSPYLGDYMSLIGFPNGIDPLTFNGNFTELINSYNGKTYIPIIAFPTGESDEISKIRDAFLSGINRLLIRICNLPQNMITPMMYLIDEAVNNVLHHSKSDKGYLFAQYYKSKGYVDIVVADVGQTFLDTYASFDKLKGEVIDDKLAMEAAVAGKSTKSQNVDRGFGISSSKDLLTRGLNGKYFILSGSVFNIHTSEINDIVQIPETIHWQGMYLCLRIPVIAPGGFSRKEPNIFI